jgi:retron-type reverse transcriptase
MKGRKQKISMMSDNCLEKNRTASDGYQGVQTFMGIAENNLAEVQQTKDSLLERILSPGNLNKAYKQVKSNKGSGGVDGMQTDELLSWLLSNKEKLIHSIVSGKYLPNPARRVEIPKEGGKKRLPGIPKLLSYYLITVYCRNVFSGTNIRIDSKFLFEY